MLFHEYACTEARRWARQTGTDRDEAESEAALAILEAIKQFDAGRGARFSTYLAQRLRGSTRAAARRERRQTRFNLAQFQPDAPIPEHSETRPPPGAFWSPKALLWAKRMRRRNDRLIVKWLWLDPDPKSQAEIARKLQITRSAVCQRRRVLMERIHHLDQSALFDQ